MFRAKCVEAKKIISQPYLVLVYLKLEYRRPETFISTAPDSCKEQESTKDRDKYRMIVSCLDQSLGKTSDLKVNNLRLIGFIFYFPSCFIIE